MKLQKYTDDIYVSEADLLIKGQSFFESVKEYRSNYIELVTNDQVNFYRIVETPTLIKRRMFKNIELKNQLSIKFNTNDFILEIAINIMQGEVYDYFDSEHIRILVEKVNKNDGDITLLTNYIATNWDLSINDIAGSLFDIPELTKKQLLFLNKLNLKQKYWKISEYQKATGSVYETARKAMDKLTSLKLFEKTKVGNKYIYKVTTTLEKIMKGGN